MEMHAIQSKQASMSSGCIVGKPETIQKPAHGKLGRTAFHSDDCPFTNTILFEARAFYLLYY